MSYCEEPRSGMYTTGTNSKMDRLVSQCGEYAEFKDETGKPLCKPHARRAVLNGHIVSPAIECAECSTNAAKYPCAGCPRRSGDERCPNCDARLLFSHRRVVCRNGCPASGGLR